VKKKLKATCEIVNFECNDIITTSGDHDNGFIDEGTLAYLVEDIKNNIKKIF
jgi:hypothetical protein